MIDSKKPDSFGVTQLNVFMAPGEAWGYPMPPMPRLLVNLTRRWELKYQSKMYTGSPGGLNPAKQV